MTKMNVECKHKQNKFSRTSTLISLQNLLGINFQQYIRLSTKVQKKFLWREFTRINT